MYRRTKVQDCSLHVRRNDLRVMDSYTFQTATRSRVDMGGFQERIQPTNTLQFVPSLEEKRISNVDSRENVNSSV